MFELLPTKSGNELKLSKMKTSILNSVLLIITVIIFSSPIYSQNKLKGTVTYDDNNNTHLNNITVTLLDVLGNPVYDCTTNDGGKFKFKNIPDGTYSLQFATNIQWSGGDIADALRIYQHMNNTYTLTPMQLVASDVNGDNVVDSADATLIIDRSLQQATGFPTGDWVFEDVDVILDSSETAVRDATTRNTGDNDVVYTPPTSKEPLSITMSNNEIISTVSNQTLSLDVRINNNIDVGAMGFIINYPSDLVRIDEITSKFEGFRYNIVDNKILFSWLDSKLKSIEFNKDDIIFTIKLQTTSDFTQGNLIKFHIDQYSKILNTKAEKLYNLSISIPSISWPSEIENTSLYQNYPNPFSSTTSIQYELTDDASSEISIFDAYGKKVFEITNPIQALGKYEINFDGSNLSPGLYIYTINVKGTNLNYTKINKMFIIR